MEFYKWIKQADYHNRVACHRYTVRALCSISFISRIKFCYEIMRGVKYHDKKTNYQGIVHKPLDKAK